MAAVIRAFGLLAAGALVVGLGAGCGSDDAGEVATDSSATPSVSDSPTDDSTAQATPSPTEEDKAAPASWPSCADVWGEGAALPKPYPGCSLDGVAVPADSVHCSMGAVLVTYDDRFWGVPGHRISRADGKLQQDADFRQVRATCTA
jgi:hypothetical protein